MAITDFLIGRPPAYDPDHDPLAKPFPGEAASIEAHIEICARRYGKIMEGQAKADLAAYDLKSFIIKAGLASVLAMAAIVKGEIILQLLKVM